jgi:hypothetical protein
MFRKPHQGKQAEAGLQIDWHSCANLGCLRNAATPRLGYGSSPWFIPSAY